MLKLNLHKRIIIIIAFSLLAFNSYAEDFDNETLMIEQDEELAKLGNIGAEFRLGARYLNGAGVKIDYDKAKELFIKASEKGHPNALYNLGYMYLYGRGVNINYGVASKYFEESSARGFAPAYHVIGVMMEDGVFYKRSVDEAIKNYKKASEAGYEPSKRRLNELGIK